jgi:HSP20 family protein
MAKTEEATKKTEGTNKPDVRRREWFELPDLSRWEMPDLFRIFDRPSALEGRLRVEEEIKDNMHVIRAEIPGIDPDKDVEISVSDGMLHIKAERRSETKEEDEGRVRSEFHYGMFSRTVPLPKGASESDVKASYKDGILEVTVPVKQPPVERQKVAVTRG